MKAATILSAVALFSLIGAAHALDIKPYSAVTLKTLQQSGQAVALHFHAPWCPTCRAQERVFQGWKGDSSVPGTLLVVDYDNERELRRTLGVRSQSTLIVYKGAKETRRLGGETDPAGLRAALDSAR
jgi:thioredoxin 1